MAGDTVDSETFMGLLREHLSLSDIPEHQWKTLHRKLTEEVYDAGNYFSMLKVINDEDDDDDASCSSWQIVVSHEDGVSPHDPDCIFLIDHAWSFVPEKARHQLTTVPGLLERMAELVEVDAGDADNDQLATEVFRELWKYCQYYEITIPSADGDVIPTPVWYVMDEFGSRIQHSDTPSFKMAPLFYAPREIAYTVIWPVVELEKGDEVTRDYANGHVTSRDAHLLPWKPLDLSLSDCKYRHLGKEYYQAHFVDETLPDLEVTYPPLPRDRVLKIYTDMDLVKRYLTDDWYEFTDSIEEANIIWMLKHYNQFKMLSDRWPEKLINQFPCEFVLTSKNLLAVTCRRKGGNVIEQETLSRRPPWLPVTYVLKQELSQFVSHYQQRQKKSLNNVWICKPWNLAHGLDMHVTDNLSYIVRLAESGPKVACKYIEDPVLFEVRDTGAVKFDIRYVVCLSSTEPLTLHAYDVFWLRFANKEFSKTDLYVDYHQCRCSYSAGYGNRGNALLLRPYSLDDFDDYQKHFTVMNYRDEAELKQVNYDEFRPLFEEQYPDYPWSDVQKDIHSMMREIFELSVSEAPPCGICPYPQSRALYAVDLMLSWKRAEDGSRVGIQPMLCEVNFNPDNTRGCQYHPNFYNHMFNLLFLGVQDNFTELL